MSRSIDTRSRIHTRVVVRLATLALAGFLAAGCGSSKSSGPTGPTGDPTSLSITPVNPAIEPGADQQLSAIARYGDGSSANVTASATWTSSDDAVMSVGDDAAHKGLASRLGDGSVAITATLGTLSATVDVSVWPTAMATTLTFDPADARGFAIGRLAGDAGAVYWAEYDGVSGGSIEMAAKIGASPTTLASGLGGINAIVSDGSYVYWTEYALANGVGSVKRVPTGGGSVEVLASGTPAGSSFDVFMPGGIAVDATYVYWGESVGGGAIRRVPKAGGTVVDLARGQGFGPSSLAISGGSLYGVTNDGGTGVAGRLPVGGGTVTVLASGVVNASNVAIDADAVYWAELIGVTGRIMRVPMAGGSATPLATGMDNPHSVEIRSGFAYFTGASGSGVDLRNGVWKVPVAGGTKTLVVANGGTGTGFDPMTVALDASYIYLVDSAGSTTGHGRLLRAPRE